MRQFADNQNALNTQEFYFQDQYLSDQLQLQRQQFITMASHELKSPVTTLKVSLELIDNALPDPSPKLQELLSLASKSILKIDLMVESLLLASQLFNSSITIKVNTFDMTDLINKVCRRLKITEYCSFENYLNQKISAKGDPVLINHVLVSLLSNAVKYSNVKPVIKIYSCVEGDKLKISVKDNGPGICSEKLSAIFRQVYEPDNYQYTHSGFGLGLYTSAQIIKMHHGDIGVDSVLGAGSTFWFTIPIFSP